MGGHLDGFLFLSFDVGAGHFIFGPQRSGWGSLFGRESDSHRISGPVSSGLVGTVMQPRRVPGAFGLEVGL